MAFSIFSQVRRPAAEAEEGAEGSNEDDDIEKCTICLSEFEIEEDVR